MDYVSASHYRVFSVDSPNLPLPAYPGKKVPTGVFTDALQRQGFVYGRHINEEHDHLVYDIAKFAEEFTEYLTAPPHKRASEMADLLTLFDLVQSRLQDGDTWTPDQPYTMAKMEDFWKDIFSKVDSPKYSDTQTLKARVTHLLRCSQEAVEYERQHERIPMMDIMHAQAAKGKRLGRFENWVIFCMALPLHEEELCARLLKSGWHEHKPDAQGYFRHLRIANSLNFDHFRAVTSR